MGLDMYLYKVYKVTEMEASLFIGSNLSKLPNGWRYFDKEDVAENNNMFKDLLPYMQPIFAYIDVIDVRKIKINNDIPEDASITGQYFNGENITFTFRWENNGENSSKDITFNEDDYILTKEVEVYLCKMENVYCWRKDYETEEAIYMRYDGVIENCGYYHLDADTVKFLNVIDDTEDIFYHEWY